MAGSFSPDFIEKVKDATDIISLIGAHTTLNRRGGKYWGLCPFHSEKSPSFSVDADKKLYNCFGCPAGGDVIKFVEEIYRYSFSEAVEYLAELAHIPVEYSEESGRDKSKYAQRKQLLSLNKEAANFFYKQLLTSTQALEYIKKRGITPQTVKLFGLGYAPSGNELYSYLRSKLYKEQDMIDAGLFKQSGGRSYPYFRDRLMFPIQDVTGNIVAFGGRIMDKGSPKYLNSPETTIFFKHNTLFNMQNARKELDENTPLIITEGYMDVISLYQAGVKNVCATLGTAFGAGHAKMISRYTDSVVISYDGDSAGLAATKKALDILEQQGLYPRVLALSGNEDPDSFVRKFGADAFREQLAKSLYSADFRISLLEQRYDIKDFSQKKRFLEQACVYVASGGDQLRWDHYSKMLAQKTDIDQAVIKQQIASAYSAQNSTNKSTNTSLATGAKAQQSPQEENTDPIIGDKTELSVLCFIIKSRESYDEFIKMGGSRVLFTSDRAQKLYDAVHEAYKDKKNVDIIKTLMYNNMLIHDVAKVVAIDADLSGIELREYVKILKISFYESEMKRLRSIISQGSGSGSEESLLVMKEYSYLKQILLKIKNGGEANE